MLVSSCTLLSRPQISCSVRNAGTREVWAHQTPSIDIIVERGASLLSTAFSFYLCFSQAEIKPEGLRRDSSTMVTGPFIMVAAVVSQYFPSRVILMETNATCPVRLTPEPDATAPLSQASPTLSIAIYGVAE